MIRGGPPTRNRARRARLAREVEIELAGGADRRDAAGLLTAQLREHRIMTPPRQIEFAVNGMLANPERGFILIARLRGAPIGVAYVSRQWSLEHGGDAAWLEELYVTPKHRNAGIGRAMLSSVLRHARKIGCRAIDLEVERSHRQAEHLYERHRFERLARARWVMTM